MKILVVSDIHSNWPALSAIEEDFDVCLFLGDAVEYGTDPSPCISWLREHATAAVRGNHDHAVAQRVPARGGEKFRELAALTRTIHWERLTATEIKFLSRLPLTQMITLDGLRFYLVHGTPRDPLDEYLLDKPDAWKRRLELVEADFVCVGHTHVPFHLELDDVQIVNPGSVGQPRDGDARCSYVIIDNGEVRFRRVEYDIQATLQQMREAGVDEEAVQLTETVLTSGGRFTDSQTDSSAGE